MYKMNSEQKLNAENVEFVTKIQPVTVKEQNDCFMVRIASPDDYDGDIE